MLIRSHFLDRRRVLRGALDGAAVAVGLPLLDLFLNDSGTAFAATGQPLPTRFGTWFWGLGIDPGIFKPTSAGPLGVLLPQLSPIESVKKYVNVFTNFDVLTDGAPNLCHFTGWVALRCGVPPTERGKLPAPSLDIAVAESIAAGTRFRSINMASTGVPRDSYSFLNSDAINVPEISAVDLYRKIFGPDFLDPNSGTFTPDPRIMMRKSVLSAVSDSRSDFMATLGAADKARLDQYFTSIREIENRLELQLQKPPPAPTCKKPGKPADVPVGLDVEIVKARHRAMTDLLAMALVCNQTRVFNMLYSDGSSALTRRGLDKTHHVLTHEEPIDPVKGYQIESSRFVDDAMVEWGYFVEKLASTPEGDGSLLDRCLVYAHSDCELAKVHSVTSIPMFTAGLAGGKVKAGLHIDGKGQAATRLGYTVQRVMDVPISSWGVKSMTANQEIGEILA